MQLGDILDDLSLDVATSSLEITRVENDSRSCEPGTLFFAMPGAKLHGAAFARDAVARGAELRRFRSAPHARCSRCGGAFDATARALGARQRHDRG